MTERVNEVAVSPTRDERIAGAVAHGSVIVFGLGMLVAAIIWLLQKDKSRYTASQALQSTVYQFVGFVINIASWCCWGVVYAASFMPIILEPNRYADAPPAFFWISMALMIVPLILMGLWILGGLWAGVRVLQGKPFRYLWIGSLVTRYMEKDNEPAATTPAD